MVIDRFIKETVDKNNNTIKDNLMHAYKIGLFEILDELNNRYVIKVWREENALDFFNDFKEWIATKNIEHFK